MSGRLGTLELAAFVAALGALATSLVAALAWRALRRPLARRLRAWHPARRARAALLVAVAPSLLPALLLALCLAPGVAGALGVGHDHCLAHGEHRHLCLIHPAASLGPAAGALLLAGFAAWALGAGREALRVARARRTLAALRGVAPGGRLALAGDPADLGDDASADLAVVGSERPFSLTVGLWRPRILLSAALVRALDPLALRVVIEHERAHARRRDALRMLVARLLSWPHLPRLRRALLAELRLAAERACDEAAARRVGDRLRVAETIVAAERLLGAAPLPVARSSPLAGSPLAGVLAPGFGEDAVPARVRALLAGEPAPPRPGTAWRFAAAGLLLALLLAEPLHHATEHLLALLF